MGEISGREALFAGFRLIAREPAAFLVWCVVYFLLGIAPQMLSLGPTLQMVGAMMAGGDVSSPDVMAAQQQVMAYQPLVYLSSLAIMALIPSAVFRAVLLPEDRGFLYLRLGAREFWLVAIVLVMVAMYFIAILVGMIPFLIVTVIVGVIVGLASAGGGDGAAGGVAIGALLGVVMMLALMFVIFWGALRFSFAPVMAFSDRTFRLTESWAFTKGRAWKMFLVGLAALAITAFVQVLVLGGLFLAAGGVETFTALGAAWTQNPAAALQRLGVPWLTAAIVAVSLVSGAAYVLWAATWADMYRQLRPGVAETFA
jgi:hypothetical protein